MFFKDLRTVIMDQKKNNIEGTVKGKAPIEAVYRIKTGKKEIITAGIVVKEGKINKRSRCYIFKNGVPISEALTIKAIKHFKKDMMEVKKGDECTIMFIDEDVSFEKGYEIFAYEWCKINSINDYQLNLFITFDFQRLSGSQSTHKLRYKSSEYSAPQNHTHPVKMQESTEDIYQWFYSYKTFSFSTEIHDVRMQ